MGAEWGAVAQRLIGAGHQWAAAQQYTLPQIEAFLAAIDKEDRARNCMALIVARAAQSDPAQFKKVMKEIG